LHQCLPWWAVVYLPGTGPHEVLRPFLRSWCCLEIITAPEDKLKIHIGELSSKIEEHRRQLAKVIARLSMKDAEAQQASDKKRIDEMRLSKYGSFEVVDSRLRKLVSAAGRDRCALATHGKLKMADEVRKGTGAAWTRSDPKYYEQMAAEAETISKLYA